MVQVAVVAIAGLYRTGKSYILNKIIGREGGFSVGPTVKACTKGIWIWGRAVEVGAPPMILHACVRLPAAVHLCLSVGGAPVQQGPQLPAHAHAICLLRCTAATTRS